MYILPESQSRGCVQEVLEGAGYKLSWYCGYWHTVVLENILLVLRNIHYHVHYPELYQAK